MSKLPDSAIESARADILEVVERYGVKLEKAGPEFRGLCPFHSEKSPSFTVTPAKGRYHCFGCGAAGDPIAFVMDFCSVPFRDAVNLINGDATDTNITPRERRVIEREQPVETWAPMATVPDSALATPDTKYLPAPKGFVVPKGMHSFTGNDGSEMVKHVAVKRWAYRDAAGALMGYIVRFDKAWGGKEVIPQTYCVDASTGECSWRWMSFGKPRPIYGLDRLMANPKAQVLVVEGEKACDATRAHFLALGIPESKLVVVSWPGGGKGVKHVDWSPLHGRSVALWPDADQKAYGERHERAGEMMPFIEQPGTVAMYDIHKALVGHCDKIKLIIPPTGVPDGWDLADELPPGFDLLKHMKTGAELVAEPAPPPEIDIDDGPPWGDEYPGEEISSTPPPAPVRERRAANDRPSRDQRAENHDKLEDPALGKNGYFRVLGYDHDRYFILAYEKCQIMVYTKGDFSESGLIELAPLDWWETHFPGKQGIDKRAAMNWLVRKANSRGVYDMERIRGRGAWTDKGRSVFHHGNYLSVDGHYTEISDLDSHFVYEMSKALPEISETELDDAEGMDLLELAGEFSWAKPASAALMAGWVALAPLGGAVTWRPHIWITGGAGSGKTTVLGKYVNFLMNGIRLFAQGNSSEAGIRQKLKCDALPVLFDESESNSEKDGMRIQSVLSMVRQASTESQAETFKGTAGGDAMSFHIRSMFCLASIQVGIKFQADIERMTVLSLRSARDDPDALDTWNRIKDALHVLNRDESLPGRLVRRSLNLLPITLKNIAVFAEAAAMRFGSQRDGDQYGTLLAGAWSLISRELVTIEAAAAMIDSYDWSEHRENNETDEGDRALAALMGALIRVQGGAELTVNELVRTASGCDVDGVTMSNSNAEAVLQRHGMRTEGKRLVLSNTSNELKRLMAGTPFEADLRGVLLRVRGADRYGNKSVKFSGVPSKAISIPLDELLTDDMPPSPEHVAAGTVEF